MNFNQMLEESKEHDKHFLDEILKKIEDGENTTFNYSFAFRLYQSIQENNEYKSEIDKYAELTIDSAMNDINENYKPAMAYRCMSSVYDYKKDKDKTLYCINKAIEIEPNDATNYLERANYLDKYGYRKRAEFDYAKAIELDPKMAEVINMKKSADKLTNSCKWLVWIIYIVSFLLVIGIILS